jgi:hypothetical protein
LQIAAGAYHDAALNANVASSASPVVDFQDTVAPTVTVGLADGQAKYTSETPVSFTVTFSEAVTNFDMQHTGGILLTSTATGATVTDIVQAVGTNTYTVTVDNMTHDGTILLSIDAGQYTDLVGNTNAASTPASSTGNQVTYDTTAPTVTVNQATNQQDPISSNPLDSNSPAVRFTVVFSEDMDEASVLAAELKLESKNTSDTLTVDSLTQTVKQIDARTYVFTVNGFSADQQGILVATLPLGTVQDLAGNDNADSTSTDNEVTIDTTALTFTVAPASTQDDPATKSPVNFTITFSRPVVDFDATMITVTTGAGSPFTSSDQAKVTLTGTGTGADAGKVYNIAVSGMISDGVVQIDVTPSSIHDQWGNEASSNQATTSASVNYVRPLTVSLNQAADQADPARDKIIHFTAKCSTPVATFSSDMIDLAGSTNPGHLVVTIGGAPTYDATSDTWDYDVQITGMGPTTEVVVAKIKMDSANPSHALLKDASGVEATVTPPTDSTVTYSVLGTIGLYDAASSQFYLKNGNTGGSPDETVVYGPSSAGWIALTGDWNGDGLDTIGLYDPATSRFYLRDTNKSGIADKTFAYGPAKAGWLPIVGDWNGDGTDTVGLYDPKTSRFYLKNQNATGTGMADLTFRYGPMNIGWQPVVGDWNGDGRDTVALYNPKMGQFYLRNTNTAGVADVTFSYGPTNRGWKPIIADWNGDGTDNVGLFDPTNSIFYLRNTNTSGVANTTFFFGSANGGFTPLAGYWQVPDASALLAAGGAVAAAPDTASLTQSELQPLVAEAITRWTAAGLPASTISTLKNVNVVISDLSGAHLGLAEGNTIYLDANAAGYGWFVDPTPATDEEFTPSGSGHQETAIDPRAVDRIDLLSVVEHELGHVAGLDDLSVLSDSLMSGVLGVGVRRNP